MPVCVYVTNNIISKIENVLSNLNLNSNMNLNQCNSLVRMLSVKLSIFAIEQLHWQDSSI